LAELGPHYDSLNESVILAVQNAAAAANPMKSRRSEHNLPCSAGMERPLLAAASGAIMKFQ
jgi:hypothetical protein